MASPTSILQATRTNSAPTETCTTAVPGKYGYVPFDACNSNYLAPPDFASNIAFAVLFGTTLLIHIVEAFAFKMPFCWVLIMGGIWETGAFTLKTLGSHHQQVEVYATIGQILFLLSPLWINAFVYMVGARMVYFGHPEKKIWGVRAIKLTVLFVWLDITCFLVQLGGGSLLSNDDNKLVSIGMKIYTGGVSLQLVFVVVFIVMMCHFYYLMHTTTGGRIGRLRFLIWTVLAVLALIVIRVVFRLVEFGPGINASNELIAVETYPLFLDAFPMVLAFVLLNIVHPGFVLRGPDSDFPRVSRKEKKERKRRQKEEQRLRKEERKHGRKHYGEIEPDSFILVDATEAWREASLAEEGRRSTTPHGPLEPRR